MSSNLDNLITEANGIIAIYTPLNGRLWSLFSGGKDSVVTAHITSQLPQFDGVIHINTKTGPMADDHNEMCEAIAHVNGWQMITKHPALLYDQLVIRYGFPGPSRHAQMFAILKEKPLRQAKKEAHKRSGTKRIAFTSGIRRAESQRRANAPEATKKDGTYWVNPLINWSKNDVLEYINRHGLAYIADQDCQCGAFAHPGEREQVIRAHSGQAAWLQYLERMVQATHDYQSQALGKSNIQAHMCRWGHGVGSSQDQPTDDDGVGLCSTCDGRLAADGSGNVGIDPDAEMVAAKQHKTA